MEKSRPPPVPRKREPLLPAKKPVRSVLNALSAEPIADPIVAETVAETVVLAVVIAVAVSQTVVLAAVIAVAVVATPRPVAKAKVPANPWRSERSTGPRL